MNPASSQPIAILGAGLTGLSAAWHLTRAGLRVMVFEAGPAPGGVIRSERNPEGWLVESGPNSMQETPAIAGLVRALGLEAVRLPAAPAAKNRYIVREGLLRALPASPPGFLRSDLFTLRTKYLLFKELFRIKQPRLSDLPLADFFREHFGQELLDYALDPFVSGIYAGDPARLSARHSFPALWKAEQEHGSLIRGMIAARRDKRTRGERTGPSPIISFTEGLASLPRALAAALPPESLRLGTPVQRITRSQDYWIVDAAPDLRFSHVIAALPPSALTRLHIGSPGSQASLASLEHLEQPPVTSLFLGYRRADVAHPLDGFGVLMPSKEKRSLLGVLFNSTLFPGRAPAGHIALTVMLGGLRNRELAAHPVEYQLPIIQRELAALLGVKGQPVFMARSHWPRAIPQYQLQHDSHLEVIHSAEKRFTGLHIGGPVCDGIGLPACVAAGERLARTVLNA
ncbi:MAG: protoporphyrinogen oxidase [Verrucomicrobia bacterium]|nr:protoporphyrinogen oxidase [Verrucomicrobiota bacterium]